MEISRLKLQLQTSLSERGVFEMKIAQLTDDLKRIESERDEVSAVGFSIVYSASQRIYPSPLLSSLL